jgi:hypothetical protein
MNDERKAPLCREELIYGPFTGQVLHEGAAGRQKLLG